MCLCYSVISHVEGVLGDAAGGARGEAERRLDGLRERRQVVALVLAEATRGDHFLDVCVGRVRGEGGAGAED